MKIHVEMKQIDNGFVVNMFDADGKEEHDKEVFIENIKNSLKAIDKWTGEIVEREGNGAE